MAGRGTRSPSRSRELTANTPLPTRRRRGRRIGSSESCRDQSAARAESALPRLRLPRYSSLPTILPGRNPGWHREGRQLVDFSHGPIADSSALDRAHGNTAESSVAVGGFHRDRRRVPRAGRRLRTGRTGRVSRFARHPLHGDRRIARQHRRGKPLCSGLRFHLRFDQRPGYGPRGGFDLVLVRDASPFHASLLVAGGVSTSLQLLSRVRPADAWPFLTRIDRAGGRRGPSTRLFRAAFRLLAGK